MTRTVVKEPSHNSGPMITKLRLFQEKLGIWTLMQYLQFKNTGNQFKFLKYWVDWLQPRVYQFAPVHQENGLRFPLVHRPLR